MALMFKVTRREPVLISPAAPTPHVYKPLSDIDDQQLLRHTPAPILLFYRYNPTMDGKDPVRVIREAIAKTLVFYYPFAGRLREVEQPGAIMKKLIVDCTGEGVMFIEADADVTIDEFGVDGIHPPFRCLDKISFDCPGSSDLLHSPLLLIQVTRLKCGGFIFAIRWNHTMADAMGTVHFLSAVTEIARGAKVPTVIPMWKRKMLSSRNPPRVTHAHPEYIQMQDDTNAETSLLRGSNDVIQKSFFIGPAEVAALLKHVPPHIRPCTTFELVTAAVWRCRTISLQYDPADKVSLVSAVNARAKFNPPLPKGYYGNSCGFPAAVATAGALCQKPVGYALELVMKAKSDVTEDYMKSVADFMVLNGRPNINLVRTYIVSDVSRFGGADFGWGKQVYGGPGHGGEREMSGLTYYIPHKNAKGQHGRLVPICLPTAAMERFVAELNLLLKDTPIEEITHATKHAKTIKSAL